MKILRIVLCYPDMDKIIVDKEQDLVKYRLEECSGADVQVSLSMDEFRALLASRMLA